MDSGITRAETFPSRDATSRFVHVSKVAKAKIDITMNWIGVVKFYPDASSRGLPKHDLTADRRDHLRCSWFIYRKGFLKI